MNISHKTGSSLSEILISLVLIAIGVSAYLSLHANSFNWQQRSQQQYLKELDSYNAEQ